jgi:hypothetical protein
MLRKVTIDAVNCSAIDSKLPGNVACWLRSRKKRSTMFIHEALVGVKSANRRPRYSQIDLSSFEVREMIRNRRHNQVFELPLTMHPRGAVKWRIETLRHISQTTAILKRSFGP